MLGQPIPSPYLYPADDATIMETKPNIAPPCRLGAVSCDVAVMLPQGIRREHWS